MIVIFQAEIGYPAKGHVIRKSVELPSPPVAGDYVEITDGGWAQQIRAVYWDVSGDVTTVLVDIEPQRLEDPLEIDELADSALHCGWEMLR